MVKLATWRIRREAAAYDRAPRISIAAPWGARDSGAPAHGPQQFRGFIQINFHPRRA